jgi:hypothetical protein
LPCENKDATLIKKSDSDKPKFENVIGNNNNAEAKIAGITLLYLFLVVNAKTHRHKFYFQPVF